MTREERIELLTSIARGEVREERMGKEGPYDVPTAVRDRLAALRMLAELDGEFERAKRDSATKGDRYSQMDERQLLLELNEGEKT